MNGLGRNIEVFPLVLNIFLYIRAYLVYILQALLALCPLSNRMSDLSFLCAEIAFRSNATWAFHLIFIVISWTCVDWLQGWYWFYIFTFFMNKKVWFPQEEEERLIWYYHVGFSNVWSVFLLGRFFPGNRLTSHGPLFLDGLQFAPIVFRWGKITTAIYDWVKSTVSFISWFFEIAKERIVIPLEAHFFRFFTRSRCSSRFFSTLFGVRGN